MLQLSSDDPRICKFLEKHIVKVVPMLNPDGVIVGNFRTSNYYFYIDFLGNDLNRSFNSDDDLINP